jgi:predicted DNA-binding transcriptional regulator YafY
MMSVVFVMSDKLLWMRKGTFLDEGQPSRMLKTSTRLLQMLTVLQRRRSWTGAELAQELDVTTRTVRNDVERLRELGYPIHASPGVAGGYRLGAGADLPPLLLNDEEAVAVAIGLASAATGAITGIEESSLRALAKLEQVMPARVRERFQAVQQSVASMPRSTAAIDARTLTTIAAACRDNQRLRFDYRSHAGAPGLRDTEPHRVVHDGRRWYLSAWDRDRSDWRTFRIDRLTLRMPVGPRFVPRPPPDGDVIAHVTRGIDQATWQYRVRLRVHAPAAELSRRLPASIAVDAIDESTSFAQVGADSPEVLTHYLTMLGAEFDFVGAPELRRHLRALGRRLLRAANAPSRGGLATARKNQASRGRQQAFRNKNARPSTPS